MCVGPCRAPTGLCICDDTTMTVIVIPVMVMMTLELAAIWAYVVGGYGDSGWGDRHLTFMWNVNERFHTFGRQFEYLSVFDSIQLFFQLLIERWNRLDRRFEFCLFYYFLLHCVEFCSFALVTGRWALSGSQVNSEWCDFLPLNSDPYVTLYHWTRTLYRLKWNVLLTL